MFDKQQTIEKIDAELWQAMQQEEQRQEQHIELYCLGKLYQSSCDGSSGHKVN